MRNLNLIDMRFRTEYEAKAGKPLDPDRKILLIGSCFSDNIGTKMRQHGLDAIVNPCGVLYNPVSISRVVRLSLKDDSPEIMELEPCDRDGHRVSFLFDSSVNGSDDAELRHRAGIALSQLRTALTDAQAVIFTFGTSFVYFLDGRPVSNCHKQPEAIFSRRMLSLGEIKCELGELITAVRTANPEIRIIATVSPVRHLRDGFEGNARSKASLLLALGETAEALGIEYFPAYEILTDDLRDYRYYADDLVHPSQQGVEYIWEKFKQTYLAPYETRLRDGLRRHKALSHNKLI